MEPENSIKKENLELYSLISPFVPLLPDFRLLNTINEEKRTSDGLLATLEEKWLLVAIELSALSRPEAERDLLLMNALFRGDCETILSLIDKAFVGAFFATYPAIVWLASKVAPRGAIVPLLLICDRRDLLENVELEGKYIKWITSPETAHYVRRRYPRLVVRKGFLHSRQKEKGRNTSWFFPFSYFSIYLRLPPRFP